MSGQDYTPERRPLAARKLAISAAATRRLAALGVAPNAISVASFVASFGCGWALYASHGIDHPRLLMISACLLLLLRGACNMLDGMVAIHTGKASRWGELYNEVPDRLSDSAILIGAGLVIPCHYDMFTFNTADASDFKVEAQKSQQKFKVLLGGECFSLNKE